MLPRDPRWKTLGSSSEKFVDIDVNQLLEKEDLGAGMVRKFNEQPLRFFESPRRNL